MILGVRKSSAGNPTLPKWSAWDLKPTWTPLQERGASLQTPGIPLSSLQALCGSRRAGIRPCRQCIQFHNFLRCACELCCWHRRIDRFLESTIYRIVGVLPAASLPHLNRGRQENNRGNCTSDTRVQALTKTNTGSEARNLYIGFSVWEGFRCVGPATYLLSPFPVPRLYTYIAL